MSFDPTDPRIQKLLEALKTQGGGKPMFGGAASHIQGGRGIRGMANYFKPGFAGINYNPLTAQMANGAPGLLGLNSGHDSNPGPPPGVPGVGGQPGNDSGQAPPVIPWNPGVDATRSTQFPNDNPDSLGAMDGAPIDPSQDPRQSVNPYNPNARRPGLQGLY